MTSTPAAERVPSGGKRILLVEDELMIRMLLEDMLKELGYTVAGEAGRIEDALVAAQKADFDLAILDVNLNGERTFPIADVLAERGVPFVFATGYGVTNLPAGFSGRPVLQKPFQQEELERVLRAALA